MKNNLLLSEIVLQKNNREFESYLNLCHVIIKRHKTSPESAINLIKEEQKIIDERKQDNKPLVLTEKDPSTILTTLKNNPISKQAISELTLYHGICILEQKCSGEKYEEISKEYQDSINYAHERGYNVTSSLDYEQLLDNQYKKAIELNGISLEIVKEIISRLNLRIVTKREKKRVLSVVNSILHEIDESPKARIILSNVKKELSKQYSKKKR